MIEHLPRFALALGLFLSQPAQAAPDLKAMHGVWRGTIGNLTVHACYDAAEHSNEASTSTCDG